METNNTGAIYGLLNAVMKEVGAVRKDSKNQQQNFNFRGIDSVVNAVYPALVKHGVIVVPRVISHDHGTVEIGQRNTKMGHVRVQVQYTFTASDGSSVTAEVIAESMDSGDKASAKAMSVAFRTALLQTLCLPTDEIDPDAESYERSPKQQTDQRVITSGKPRPVREDAGEQFQPAARAARPADAAKPQGAMSKAQQVYVGRRVNNDMTKISEIIGRVVESMDECSQDEGKRLVDFVNGAAAQPEEEF